MRYGARKTARNAVMFEKGGLSYVYLCYGIHFLFNVVTNRADVPEAVLIRALEPLAGLEEMRIRRGILVKDIHLTSGPGKLTKALGIGRSFNGKSLRDDEIWIEDSGTKMSLTKALLPANESESTTPAKMRDCPGAFPSRITPGSANNPMPSSLYYF